MTQKKMTEIWASQPAGTLTNLRSGGLRVAGDRVMSFQTCIALKEMDGRFLVTSRSYSATTDRHTKMITNALFSVGASFEVQDF